MSAYKLAEKFLRRSIVDGLKDSSLICALIEQLVEDHKVLLEEFKDMEKRLNIAEAAVEGVNSRIEKKL